MKKRMPMLWAVALSLVIATSMGLRSAPSAAAEKGSVDFSPGNADQLFALPKEMWSNINQFAFLICYDYGEPALRTRVRELSGYSELYSNCVVWGEFTFPTLRTLATELSKGDIKELLLRLQAAFRSLRNNPTGARGEFNQTADSLNGKLATLSDLSGRVNQQSMAFYKVSNVVFAEYKRRNLPEVNIGPKMDDVGLAMGSMAGRWNVLTSNLAYLRKTLELPTGNAGIPELYDLDIEVGLNAWDEIARRARLFLADVSAQFKYLSGENYYEECPLNEGQWYVMRNSFLDATGLVLTAQGPGPIPSGGRSYTADVMMKPHEKQPEKINNYGNYVSQQWRFHRLRRGWWSIESRIRNDVGYPIFAALLDSTVHVQLTELDGFSSYYSSSGRAKREPPAEFWWRCLSAAAQGSPGWFRLVNATVGELQSLGIYDIPDKFFPGFMGGSGQFWKLEPAEKP